VFRQQRTPIPTKSATGLKGLTTRSATNLKGSTKAAAQSVAGKSRNPSCGHYGACQYMLSHPEGKVSGSVILLASYLAEHGFWSWMYGDKLSELSQKPWRIIEVIPRSVKMYHGNWEASWYRYGSNYAWKTENPHPGDLTEAVDFIHELILQEYAIVRDFKRIVLAGYSQGAVMALEASLRFPHQLGATVSQRGVLLDSRLANKTQVEKSPYYLTAGSLDDVYPDYWVMQGLSFLQGKNVPTSFKIFDGMDHHMRDDREISHVLTCFAYALP